MQSSEGTKTFKLFMTVKNIKFNILASAYHVTHNSYTQPEQNTSGQNVVQKIARLDNMQAGFVAKDDKMSVLSNPQKYFSIYSKTCQQ